jgi:acetamidase/formamidase
MSKNLIEFNQQAYEKELAKHNAYKLELAELKAYITDQTNINLDGIDFTTVKAFKEVCNRFAELHAEANTLKLKPLKLMQLMDVNSSEIHLRISQIANNPNTEPPKKENFSWYAKTPEQIAKLKTAKDLLKMVKSTGIQPKFDNLFKAPIVNKTGKYEINRFYILPIA